MKGARFRWRALYTTCDPSRKPCLSRYVKTEPTRGDETWRGWTKLSRRERNGSNNFSFDARGHCRCRWRSPEKSDLSGSPQCVSTAHFPIDRALRKNAFSILMRARMHGASRSAESSSYALHHQLPPASFERRGARGLVATPSKGRRCSLVMFAGGDVRVASVTSRSATAAATSDATPWCRHRCVPSTLARSQDRPRSN